MSHVVDEVFNQSERERIEKALKRYGLMLDDDVYDDIFKYFEVMEFVTSCEKCEHCSIEEGGKCCSTSQGLHAVIERDGHVQYEYCDKYRRYKTLFVATKRQEETKVPKAYKKMTFDTLESSGNCQAITYAKELALGNTEKGMFLFGSPGNGKTHIAISTLQEWVKERQGLFYTMPVLAGEWRCFAKDDSKISELNGKIEAVDLLVIDDVGAEKWSEWIGQCMFNLLNTRYINGKRTIITSNLSLDELETHMQEQGARITSRIAGMCEIFEIVGKDRRLF